MANILLIETATQVCSIALSIDGVAMHLRESNEKNVHSARITLFISEVMELASLTYQDLDAVAVSMGPGSYTGLRIGVSTAKGICYAVDKPLIAINTLQSMAAGMPSPGTPSLLCPMIDARRMEVYTALFTPDLEVYRETKAEIIDEKSFAAELENYQVWFFGDGAEKCKSVLGNNPNAHFVDDFQISSAFMSALAEDKYRKSDFEDVAYFEPFYLKDFIPGKPKVKGL
jgi:tRNA threonylcarbamoyladenosine biosynthesis protein TsaB